MNRNPANLRQRTPRARRARESCRRKGISPGGGQPNEKSSAKGGQGDAGKSNSSPPNGSKSGDKPADPGKAGEAGKQRIGTGASSIPEDGKASESARGGPGGADAPKPPNDTVDDAPPSPEDEQANLEFARKATNLVLNRLKDQLSRGEVDQELLDELGWKDRKDVEKLVNFLDKGLNGGDDDNSPEAIARRLQFEETLKSLRLGNASGRRAGGSGTTRQVPQYQGKNIPVPPEYRKQYESYTRSLSKQSEAAADKAGAAKTKKAGGK